MQGNHKIETYQDDLGALSSNLLWDKFIVQGCLYEGNW